MTTPDTPLFPQVAYYSQVKDTIQTGDLLAWKITRFNSIFTFVLYLYHKLFKAKYSHVAVVLRLGDRVFAVEATSPQVRMMPIHRLGNFYLVKAGVQAQKRHTSLLTEHLGKKYGLMDMVLDMFDVETNDEELYCSELAKQFYEDIGFFATSSDDDSRTPTPDEIVAMVQSAANTEPVFIRIDKGNLYVS